MTSEKLRGVNLGGWLLLEKWMTPSLFEDTQAEDEYTFMRTPNADKKIEAHRKSFITESDFKWMKQHGINAVRIPIGYWALNDSTPFISVRPYLDWAMQMAAAYDIAVIIDLHALQGSQNGFDHSGKIGKAEWFQNKDYRNATLRTLESLAETYKNHPNLWGLQIINEPRVGLVQLKLRRFYKDAYIRLAKILHPHTRIIYSDAFTPRLFSGIFPRRGHPVAMDVHIYQMTTFFSKYFSIDWYYRYLLRRKTLLRRLSQHQPIIIGEWSGALRQTTYDQIPTRQHPALTKHYTQLQLELFDEVEGWFYWNYKTEKPGVWSFRSQVDDGVITLG